MLETEALLVSSTLQARLDVIRSGGTIPAPAIDAFAKWVHDAEEEDLFRMSPLRWGRASGVSDKDAIELFLRATHAGILEFAWGVICPTCAGFLATPAGLRAMDGRFCSLCEIPIEVQVSESVEVAFTVSPGVRRIRFHTPDKLDIAIDGVSSLFSGNVGRGLEMREKVGRNVLSGGHMEGHSMHTERTTLSPNRYMVVVPASNTTCRFRAVENGERDDLEIDLFDGRAVASVPEVRSGRLDLTLRNKSGMSIEYLLAIDPKPTQEEMIATKDQFVKHLQKVAESDAWLSGRRLLTSQAFHELFRAETIPAEQGIDVKGLSILFTDLQGSTRLYQQAGDLRAFEMVREHFGVLKDCVSSSGGAVVKTIGDAVMAVFSEPRAAVEAAVQMHRRIARVAPGDLALKIGLHEGPCIAVHMNERLDYFGTTVNVAARVQGKAAGGEIVLTETSFKATDVEKLLRSAEFVGAKENVELRGIEGTVPIVRLKPAVPA